MGYPAAISLLSRQPEEDAVSKTIAAIGIGVLGVAGIIAGATLAPSANRPSPGPSVIINGYAEMAMPPAVRAATADQLAVRSFKIPGVRDVLLVKVTELHDAVAIQRDKTGQPARIVTDYSITVIKQWHRGALPRATPTLLRVPGGQVGGTIERAEAAPPIAVGSEYLLWDQSQPPAAAAGPSAEGIVVIPNEGDIATVSTAGVVNWAGKLTTLTRIDHALTQGASQ